MEPALDLGTDVYVCRTHATSRGVSLVEILVSIAIVALLTGGAFFGTGALNRSRLRESATLVASAIRVAYDHASATSRPTRLVFDFETRRVTLEDSAGRMFLEHGQRTGGAQAATDLERDVVAEAASIVEGTRIARPQFQPVTKPLGFEYEDGKVASKQLKGDIFYRQIEVEHEDGPVTSERVYLYFFPGGQTERASIQLQFGRDATDDKYILSLLVSPLTGKVYIDGGPVEMRRPLTDEEASEREDNF